MCAGKELNLRTWKEKRTCDGVCNAFFFALLAYTFFYTGLHYLQASIFLRVKKKEKWRRKRAMLYIASQAAPNDKHFFVKCTCEYFFQPQQ